MQETVDELEFRQLALGGAEFAFQPLAQLRLPGEPVPSGRFRTGGFWFSEGFPGGLAERGRVGRPVRR